MPDLQELTSAEDFELLVPNRDLIKFNNNPSLYLGKLPDGRVRVLRRSDWDIYETTFDPSQGRFMGGGVCCIKANTFHNRIYSVGGLNDTCSFDSYRKKSDLLEQNGIPRPQ